MSLSAENVLCDNSPFLILIHITNCGFEKSFAKILFGFVPITGKESSEYSFPL